MRFNLLCLLALVFCTVLPSSAQDNYIRTYSGTFALTNARIETITHGVIENGTVVLRDGRIEAVGSEVAAPPDAEVIDCSGLTIYPGMIDGGTRLGLQEVGSLPETIDHGEIGDIRPHMQALTAVNPNSVNIPVTRVSGVTTVLTMPSGGQMPGTAALINLHGYTPDQMFAGFKGVVLNFPSSARYGSFDRRSDEDIEKQFNEALEQLNETWEQAVLFERIDRDGGNNLYQPEMEALLPVLRGEAPLLIEVNAAKDIQKALEWIEEKEVEVILTGVAEGWRVADEIAEADIPVITGPVLTTPSRDYDRYDAAYRNAGWMRDAGVTVAIRTQEVENVRNLPFNAGFAAAYGMGREAALEAVTIVPARIFGVDDRLGSIEEGKEATLFVADGDPFQTQTQIVDLFIGGYRVPIESRHISLYNEFLNRNPGL
ncbi:MAG: amidohydrolase family protein [Rubricoccaceae bacterium]|nr:amidohydrolase family protein [Rubricoccaceae bacterium]